MVKLDCHTVEPIHIAPNSGPTLYGTVPSYLEGVDVLIERYFTSFRNDSVSKYF